MAPPSKLRPETDMCLTTTLDSRTAIGIAYSSIIIVPPLPSTARNSHLLKCLVDWLHNIYRVKLFYSNMYTPSPPLHLRRGREAVSHLCPPEMCQIRSAILVSQNGLVLKGLAAENCVADHFSWHKWTSSFITVGMFEPPHLWLFWTNGLYIRLRKGTEGRVFFTQDYIYRFIPDILGPIPSD